MNTESKKIRNSKLLRLSFALTLFICFGWLAIGHANHAWADTNVSIGNIAPLPQSADIYVDPNGNNPTPTSVGAGQPALEVGNGSFDGNYLWLKVYVPNTTAATVTIQNGAGWCNNVNDMTDLNEHPHVIYKLVDLGADETIPTSLGSYSDSLDNLAGGNACGNLSFSEITAGQGTPSNRTGHSGYRVFMFEAHIVNCPDSDPTCFEAIKEFRVFAEPNNNTTFTYAPFAAGVPLVGFSRTIDATQANAAPFGIAYPNLRNDPGIGSDSDFTFDTQFGTYCSESNPSANITFANMDSTSYDPQFLSADLYRSDATLAVPSWQHIPPDPHTWPGSGLGSGPYSIVNESFDAEPQFNYKLYVNRVNQNNAMQFYVPYDQFDASPATSQCFQSTCNIIPPSSSSLLVGNAFVFKVNMVNNGLDTWQPPGYYLNQNDTTTDANSPYAFSPSAQVPTGGSYLFDVSVTNNAPGQFTYVYSMADSMGVFGATCSIKLTWTNQALYPYFKVQNGDISAGGGFQDANGNCNANNPNDYIDPNNGGNQYYGGIRAYADPDFDASGSPKGSSVDFGAYALGLITGTSPPNAVPGATPYGFYSSAANPSTLGNPTYSAFDFANQNVLGGLMGGLTDPNPNAHCSPDYFDNTIDTSSAVLGTEDSITLDGTQSGQNLITPASGTLQINQVSGPVVTNLTEYVNGDVYITSDITTGAWGFDTDPNSSTFSSNDAPYFALIVKGNIYIAPGVSRLDGLYVAQPKDDGTEGVLSTCAPTSGTDATPDQVSLQCHSPLTFNGAVVAQHVHLLRSNGDVLGLDNSGPAEVFNFTPSIVLGQPDFLQPPVSGAEDQTSLPPVF